MTKIDLNRALGPQSEWLARRLAKDFDTSIAARETILEIPRVKELAVTNDLVKLHATYLLLLRWEKANRVRGVLSEAMCALSNGQVAIFEQRRKWIEAWLTKRDATLLPAAPIRSGAQMGRRDATLDFSEPRSINLFEVKLDSGGYDNGGAYWGRGEPLYVARQVGALSFVRERGRLEALIALAIPWRCLKFPPTKEFNQLKKLHEAGHLSISGRLTYSEIEELRNA